MCTKITERKLQVSTFLLLFRRRYFLVAYVVIAFLNFVTEVPTPYTLNPEPYTLHPEP